jgi:hypothetical protein
MKEKVGRWVGLSVHRIMVGDLMYFSRRVPTIPAQRRMQLGAVKAARGRLTQRPSWVTLFAKAFDLVAADTPVLRRSYLGLPWAHLYEHPISVASIAVEKMERGAPEVFFAKLRNPGRHRLGALDRYLRWFIRSPKANMGLARVGLWVSLLWWPLRRVLWWWALNAEGYFRARQFGTFGITVYSGMGVESLHPLSPLTFVLNYGVIDEEGNVTVRLIYDHRVLDGATVARALLAIEAAMTGPILAELNGQLPARRPVAAAADQSGK